MKKVLLLSVFPLIISAMEHEKNILGNHESIQKLYEKVQATPDREERLNVQEGTMDIRSGWAAGHTHEDSDSDDELKQAMREFQSELVKVAPVLFEMDEQEKKSRERLNPFMQEILAAPDAQTRREVTNNYTDLYNEILAEASTPEETEVIKSTYEGLQRDDNETLEKVRMIWGKNNN